MKSLIAVLMGVVTMLLVFSCATVPTEPLASGELRLLSMQVPSQITGGFPYDLIIIFRADGKPEISKACCSWSGGGPYCLKARNLKYGSPGNFIIELPRLTLGNIQWNVMLNIYGTGRRNGVT